MNGPCTSCPSNVRRSLSTKLAPAGALTEPEPLVDYLASTQGGRDLSKSERAVIRQRVEEEIAARGHFAVTIDVGVIRGRAISG